MTDFEHEDEAQEREEATQRLIAAYRRLFSGPDAGIVVADLIRFCGVFNGVESEIEEGKRLTAVYILRMSGVEAKFKNIVEAL
jgi:hypothetical protein